MNWSWLRGVLAPLDAFLYKRRAEQLETLAEELMLQVFECGKDPQTTVGDGTNPLVMGIYWKAQHRARERDEADARMKKRIWKHQHEPGYRPPEDL